MITLNHLIPFPLTTIIIGGHEPQWVEEVLARVGELDQQELNDIDALSLLTGFMIIVAWDEVGRNEIGIQARRHCGSVD